MKKIVLILAMMLIGITSFAQETDYRSIKPPKGKSLVYIVRPSIFGLAAEFQVYANGQYLGSTFGRKYLYSVFEPGDQIITNTAENKNALILKTEADKTYFVKQAVDMGLLAARSELTLLNEDEGRKALMKCGLSKTNVYSFNAIDTSHLDVTATFQNTQDVIYLKNGAIIKGTIVEQVIGESIKVKSASGFIRSYSVNDIDKFERENRDRASLNQQSGSQKINLREHTFKVGVDFTAGYVFSWLSGFNDATGYEGYLKSAYEAGFGVTIPFDQTWGAETGIGYLFMSGNNYTYEGNSVFIEDGKVDLHYVEVPLLVRYDLMKKQNIKNTTSIGLRSGPQFGFNTYAHDSGKLTGNGNIGYSYNSDLDVKTNIDWVLGVYAFTGRSGVSLNFNYGFSKVLKNDENSKNFKNKSISILYSYRF